MCVSAVGTQRALEAQRVAARSPWGIPTAVQALDPRENPNFFKGTDMPVDDDDLTSGYKTLDMRDFSGPQAEFTASKGSKSGRSGAQSSSRRRGSGGSGSSSKRSKKALSPPTQKSAHKLSPAALSTRTYAEDLITIGKPVASVLISDAATATPGSKQSQLSVCVWMYVNVSVREPNASRPCCLDARLCVCALVCVCVCV